MIDSPAPASTSLSRRFRPSHQFELVRVDRLRTATTTCGLIAVALFSSGQSAAQSSLDPSSAATFDQAISGMNTLRSYTFGTGPGNSIRNLQQLANSFDPYGIGGTTVANQEWERYQPFNNQNFVFTGSSLNLTATIPTSGGLFPGGINSGKICSKMSFIPGKTGFSVYAVEVRMKIPSAQGTWPAAWFYTQAPGVNDGSEIDNPEFFVMQRQSQFDWTGYQHGPGAGADIYSIKTDANVWHPGLNFAADYHDYGTVWTPDAVYKYVDGTLVYAAYFTWTASGSAQMIVNLAVGSSDTLDMPGLQPVSLSDFPSSLSIESITVWAK